MIEARRDARHSRKVRAAMNAWLRDHPWRADGLLAFISPKVVEKRVASIFDKLGLAPDDNDNRRVIAALRYLES